MTKTGAARLSAGTILLTLVLIGCAGGGSDDAKAAAAVAQGMLSSDDSGFTIDESQADCVGEGFVDQIGVDRLQQYGFLTESLESAADDMESTQMDESDADNAARVFIDCVDGEARMAEQMAEDPDLTQEQQECIREQVDAELLKRTFSLLFQGREDEAQEALMGPAFQCMFGGPSDE